MAPRPEFKLILPIQSPNELYQKHKAKIDADTSGGTILRNYLIEELVAAFVKLRINRLEEIPSGDSNIRSELVSLLTSMLNRAKRGEANASMRFSFEMVHDQGHKKRTVTIDISLAQAKITVIGIPPIEGIDGFLRERGRYAQERKTGQGKSERVDHYITGKFAQTEKGELLAVIDNTRVAGEPGIDVRGSVVKPQHAVKYQIEFGEGVEKRERISGKIELYSAINGVVKTRYDGEEKLRHLAVDGSLKMGEVGFRAGGNVMARGDGGKAKALSLETAEFRSIPAAFETRTNGAIYVKETIQGKVVGASVSADMVNQAAGKFIVATEGEINISRSVQGGFLYAPEISIGNGRVIATLMNGQLAARNHFVGQNLLLVGRNQLILGSDLFREGCSTDKCTLSGQDLFAGRRMLVVSVKQKEAEIKTHSDLIGKALLGSIQKRVTAGQSLNREAIRQMLEQTSELEKKFIACSHEEEEALRLSLTHLFYDIGVENPMPILQRFSQKKGLRGELAQLEEKLAMLTQDIDARFHIAECKDGSQFIVQCWEDTLVFKGFEQEMLVERLAGEEQLYQGPKQSRTVALAFDYQSEKLSCEITG